ncbi:MAG: HEAT repeat domain-containing protein [Myxococcales bacterium]|nr:HEAT repeat domain-containing protein [Myxococcales bacterium]
MLSGVDSGPRPAEVANLGAGVVPILEALHRDAQLEPFVRARAVEALGWTRLPLAARSLRPIVERDPNPFFVRAALVAIARLEGTGAVTLIADRLGHPSSVVRMGAVEGLALVGTEAARHSLRARLSVERHAGVRRALERAIVRGPAAVARTRGVTSATQTATPNDAAKGRSRTREGH